MTEEERLEGRISLSVMVEFIRQVREPRICHRDRSKECPTGNNLDDAKSTLPLHIVLLVGRTYTRNLIHLLEDYISRERGFKFSPGNDR